MTIYDLRTALRLTVEDYDLEILALAQAGMADLAMAGVTGCTDMSALDDVTAQAVKTYVRAHFGSPDDYDRLKAAFDEQKAQLMTATGHTDWGDGA